MAGLFDFTDYGNDSGGILPSQQNSGGFMSRINGAINNPLTLFGLALASGRSASEGFGNAVESQLALQKLAQADLTGDIKEYQYAVKTGSFKGSFADWQKSQANLKSQFGLQGQWVQKPDGSWGLVQLNNQGEAREVPAPGGGKWSPTGSWKDVGTGLQNLPSRMAPYGVGPGAGQPGQPTTSATDDMGRPVAQEPAGPILNPGFVPKDVAGAAAQKKLGTDTGQAQFDLPRIEQNSQQVLDTIQQLREHPGKKYGVGVLGVLPGIPGTDQKDFVSMVDQVKGKAFLEAYNTLKGGGQITEIEGKKATDAIARLDRTQSPTGFDKALNDLEGVVRTGLARARVQAKKMGVAPSAPSEDTGGDWTTLPGGIRIRQK